MGSSKAYWYVENHVVYVQNLGDLTAEDFREVDREIVAKMKDAHATAKVHVLVDCMEMRGLPSVLELEGGRILKYMQEPNCGYTVVVGYRNNPLLKVLSRFLANIMGANLYMADRLSKGASYLTQIDDHLREIPDVDQWKESFLSKPDH